MLKNCAYKAMFLEQILCTLYTGQIQDKTNGCNLPNQDATVVILTGLGPGRLSCLLMLVTI